MTCQELVDFLMDYLDGALPAAQRAHFEEHLGECPDCVHYLASYQQTVRQGKQACQENDDGIPASVPEDLIQAILCARRR